MANVLYGGALPLRIHADCSSCEKFCDEAKAMPEKAAAAESSLMVEIDRTRATPVVRCTGRLVAGLSDRLYDQVRTVLPGPKYIVIDCTHLSRMDSTGLGTLVRVYVHAKSAGCTIQLMNIGPSIRQLLRITELLSAFTIIGENNIKLG
jgi:anti-sigma B factor antagonist